MTRLIRWWGCSVSVVAAALVCAPTSTASAESAGAAPGSGRGKAAALDLGDYHSCVVRDGGSPVCWGFNGQGELGIGTTDARGDQAGEVAALAGIDLGAGLTATALAAGTHHSCALLNDGSIKCWGDNQSGQLGYGDTADRGDGAGEMGGSLPRADLGAGRTAAAIAAGSEHTCAILDDGSVKCWGWNGGGQLGYGDGANRGDNTGEMGDNLPRVDLGTGRTATAITAGYLHTCALLDDGTVKCWGANGQAQLGLGDTDPRGIAAGQMGDALPAVPLGRPARAISAGFAHTCALLDNGVLKCWGGNTRGQLGYGDVNTRGDTPGEIAGLAGVDLGTGRTAVALAVTSDSLGGATCAILDTGTVKCWGYNNRGQLGYGDTQIRGDGAGEMGDQLPAVALGTGATATGIAAGADTVCVILGSGVIKCWGYGQFGQLGLGNTGDRGDAVAQMGDSLPVVPLTGNAVHGVPVAPAAPTGLVVAGVAGGWSASWIAPADTGGSALTAFVLQRSTDGVTWSPLATATATTVSQAGAAGDTFRVRVAARNAVGLSPFSPPSAPLTIGAITPLVTVDPARLLDTRPGGQTVDGEGRPGAPVAAGRTVEVRIAGRGGVPADAAAAVLNVTAVGPDAAGFASVYPCGAPPNASNLNYQPRQDIPNAVVAKLSASGTACILTSAAANLLVDVNGYAPAGSSLTTVDPARLLDTRQGGRTVDGEGQTGTRLGAGGTIEVRIAGRGGVPSGAATAVLNVTAVGPDAAGFASVYPCGAPPNASNLNYQPGQDIPNAVVAKLSASGTVCILSSSAANFLVDVNGFTSAGSALTTVDPARLLDTRAGGQTVDGQSRPGTPVPANGATEVKIAGRGGVPPTATTALLNITAVGPDAAGFASVYPCGTPPNASNLNFQPGQDIPNAVVAKLSPTGTVCIFTSATADYLIDVNGSA